MVPRRRFRPRSRKSSVRDARLIIIAAEGEKTEKQYFDALASSDAYANPKAHVEVLSRNTPNSAPDHVLEQLDTFKRKYNLNRHDELWMVIDYDRWGEEKLSSIAAKCSQKRYLLAVSNPCIELWLLLHVAELSEYSPQVLDEFYKSPKVSTTRNRIGQELLNILGSYNKSNLNMDHFLPHVEKAISQATRLDTNPDHRWPNELGTRVYRVAKSIIRRDQI